MIGLSHGHGDSPSCAVGTQWCSTPGSSQPRWAARFNARVQNELPWVRRLRQRLCG